MPEMDPRPFPVRAFRADNGVSLPASTIPSYVAIIVHKLMKRHYGDVPPLEKLAEQGGFNPSVMLDLLAGGIGDGKAFRALIANEVASVKDSLQVVVPGTKAYAESMKELEAEAQERARQESKLTFGHGLSRTTR